MQCGLGFMFAPSHHAAMRHVGKVRRELGVRTIFNLLGPLANPAATKYQIVGVFEEKWVEPIANVLGILGVERAWVVHGADGLDELTTTTVSHVAVLDGGKVSTFRLSPRNAGVAEAKPDDLIGGGCCRERGPHPCRSARKPGAVSRYRTFERRRRLVGGGQGQHLARRCGAGRPVHR